MNLDLRPYTGVNYIYEITVCDYGHPFTATTGVNEQMNSAGGSRHPHLYRIADVIASGGYSLIKSNEKPVAHPSGISHQTARRIFEVIASGGYSLLESPERGAKLPPDLGTEDGDAAPSCRPGQGSQR